MIQFTLAQLSEILQQPLHGESVTVTGISIDTRAIVPGNLFIAIVGATFDGNDFVAQAHAAGAVAAIVSRPIECDIPHIIVPNTTIAMGDIARAWRRQAKIPFVGITGSCGKTTTTQMTGAILNVVGPTLVPQGNKNNQWGVPLTLFQLQPEHRYAVIEMGADRPTEIQYLASIAQPTISVITNVAPVHLEVSEGIGFGSVDGVFNEKSEIFRALGPDGIAVVCADDAYYPQWQMLLANTQYISFGFNASADVRAAKLQPNEQMQYAFDLITPKGEIRVQLSALGRHNVVNALAASAVALALDIPLSVIAEGLGQVPTVARRMIRLLTQQGAILIDDSYNSNVRSAKSVLEMLCEQAGTRIAVLGDMLEMGELSEAAHREVGEYAKQMGIDHFYAFGKAARFMAEGFGAEAKHFTDVNELIAVLNAEVDANTVLVVKGSHGMGMDRIVQALVA